MKQSHSLRSGFCCRLKVWRNESFGLPPLYHLVKWSFEDTTVTELVSLTLSHYEFRRIFEGIPCDKYRRSYLFYLEWKVMVWGMGAL